MTQYIQIPLNSDAIEQLKAQEDVSFFIKVSDIDFGKSHLNEDKINTTFIYIRNIDLDVQLDFDGVSYDNRCEWVLEYLKSSLYGLHIPTLSETILNLLCDEKLHVSNIFNEEETQTFKNTYVEILGDLRQFLVSINLAVVLLEQNDPTTIEQAMEEYDGKSIQYKPEFLDCAISLIGNYPVIVDAIRMFYLQSTHQVLYTHFVESIVKKNSIKEALLKLPSVQIFTHISAAPISKET